MKIDRPEFSQPANSYTPAEGSTAHPGYYFITLVSWEQKPNFSSIVNRSIQLSASGRIVWREWKNLDQHFPGIRMEEFVVMPNHLHGLILYKDTPRSTVSLVNLIDAFKLTTTRMIHDLNRGTDPIWQRTHSDHPVHQEELDRVRKMIQTNPQRWEQDEYYRPGKAQTGHLTQA
jgi:REP element-mobilizing transposase RayT